MCLATRVASSNQKMGKGRVTKIILRSQESLCLSLLFLGVYFSCWVCNPRARDSEMLMSHERCCPTTLRARKKSHEVVGYAIRAFADKILQAKEGASNDCATDSSASTNMITS